MSDTATTATDRVRDRIRAQKSESTAKRYLRAVDRYFEWLGGRGIDPFEATPLDFEDYMTGVIDEGFAFGTLEPRLQGPRAFYQTAEDLRERQQQQKEHGREARTPEIPEVHDPTEGFALGDWNVDRRSKQSKGLQAKDDHHKLTQEEIDQLVDHAPTPKFRNGLLIRLMHQCCLRRSEVVRLKVDDLNQNDSPPTIDVPAVKGNKGRDTRIPYKQSLNELLTTWIEVDRDGEAKAPTSDYLFPTSHSERIAEDTVSTVVRTAAEQAPDVEQRTLYKDTEGREKRMIHSHTLRASGAHRIWDQSKDIYLVSQILGHSDVETTERYIDPDPEEIITKAFDAL